MWVMHAVVVHLLLLGSIFVIYFTSPVLRGLQPQPLLPLDAPAKRLVLIVTDGLRAESFFRDNCADVPHLRRLLHSGVVGVSRTHVPTESRPGHIALIAGMYEDPSAVTRGWKENPIDFDTVFNRSSRTFAWGANDVLHIFSRLDGAEHRLLAEVYDTDLDFSGRTKTHELDDWVFERVHVLLQRKAAELRYEEQVVFFLHLLGLDSAGHIHKPGTPLFLENLHSTERGIYDIFQRFEAAFPDKRTAYILTSDHGMTNSGSHGSGDIMETDTPFFLWGAGIAQSPTLPAQTFGISANETLPLHELEQAQLAPLMSALLGLPPPVNNFGTLPVQFLNASDAYKAYAAHSNAMQLLAQFKELATEHQRGLFAPLMRQFGELILSHVASYERQAQAQLVRGDYTAVLHSSQKMMAHALAGIDYYNRYYQHALLFSTALAFAGWFCYLLQLLFASASKSNRQHRTSWPRLRLWYAAAAALLVGFILLQRVPLTTSLYFLFPLLVWCLVLREQRVSWSTARAALASEAVLLLLSVELLVLTFFERRFIALAYGLMATVNHFNTPIAIRKSRRHYVWLLFAAALLTVPLLPSPLGWQNIYLHLLGIIVTLARSQSTKWRLRGKALIMPLTALLNAGICAYQHEHQIAISLVSQCVSWCYLAYVFFVIVRQRSAELKHRIMFIYFHLTTLYTLFCTSYEAIFVVLITSELLLALQQQAPTARIDASAVSSHLTQVRAAMRLAFTTLLYTLFSFFGVGNIASISSFDPNIIRCFLTTFSPFVIMSLVVVKLLLPLIVIMAILFSVTSATARCTERQLFICLLLVCDIMCLNFLFLVRNQGSWLEIGSSISHFVIMEVTTLALVLLSQFVKLLLRLDKIK